MEKCDCPRYQLRKTSLINKQSHIGRGKTESLLECAVSIERTILLPFIKEYHVRTAFSGVHQFYEVISLTREPYNLVQLYGSLCVNFRFNQALKYFIYTLTTFQVQRGDCLL